MPPKKLGTKPADLYVEDNMVKVEENFIKSLMKIHSPVTLEVGLKECQRMINEGRHSRQMVRIAITALTDISIMYH